MRSAWRRSSRAAASPCAGKCRATNAKWRCALRSRRSRARSHGWRNCSTTSRTKPVGLPAPRRRRLESAIRAGRAELAAEQEHLQARLLALRAELETRLLEIDAESRKGRGTARRWRSSRGIMEVERDIADINEDLALCILDHLDGLATRASELRERATRASVEAAAALRIKLHETRSPHAEVSRRPDCHAGVLCVPGTAVRGADTSERQAGKGRDGSDATRSRPRSWNSVTPC